MTSVMKPDIPAAPMFTLGHNFAPAHIHAGGLRYHGAGVIVSQLLKDNLMEAVDIQQLESFRSRLSVRTGGRYYSGTGIQSRDCCRYTRSKGVQGNRRRESDSVQPVRTRSDRYGIL